VARDPAILVLDDALSSIDAATESRILDELESVMEGRSSIIVSHRVAAVRRADRVVVLEEGRVVEDGTPDELAVAGGLYSRLLERQQLADELEAM
jgi:ATP-binding cassette subfamily B protein